MFLTHSVDTFVASHGDTGRRVNVSSKPVKPYGGGSSPQVKLVSPGTPSMAQTQSNLGYVTVFLAVKLATVLSSV